MKRFGLIAGGVIFFIGLAIGLALLLPQRHNIYDFVVLYAASLGVLNHVPIYNTIALQTLLETHIGAAPGTIGLFPYPYPPWYALSTVYLGLLRPQMAVNVWLILNIAMLVTSTLLLTDGWKPLHRILTTLAGLIFVPALGLLVVGQYSAPVLLGAALFVYAARREDAPLTALGLLLTTFKPHLGLLLFLAGFLWLVFQKSFFARRALWQVVIGGLVLATLGFIADPAWPLTYIQSLLSYRDLPGVSSCGLCASLSVLIVKVATGHSDTLQAAWVSLILAASLGAWLLWRKTAFLKAPAALMALSALLTLLIDPYLLNYDYVLLLLPLIILTEKRYAGWLALAYCLPWGALIFGREANFLITLAGVLVLGLLITDLRQTKDI